jgi:hypothetical protein
MRRRSIVCVVAWVLTWFAPALGQEPVPRIDHLIQPLAERAARWRCDITTRFVCTKSGCKQPAPVGTWVELDFDARTYGRCDSGGCNRYPLQQERSGIYTIASGGLQSYLKTLNDGSEFMESSASGTSAFINYGRCVSRP